VNHVRVHAALTILWFLAAFPICILLANSIPFLVFISVYAVVASHWAAWQAAKTEERQIEMEQEELND
jgi:hypothetical protein